MSIKRDLHSEQKLGLTWEDLGAGAPMIIALARLASQAIATESGVSDLSGEARALLFAARDRSCNHAIVLLDYMNETRHGPTDAAI